ncbi:FadR/GntR family transcriptional regulator [Desulfobotulus sp.]|uniref:FadR/GntR family transcriptional regulator n=1 Tax=Desulfobotulus sp. TaxID=1940337 RepID=UPI002A358641|nr:FadR/GntR family transcriptional regulator [Desulfobotulus sp.]MDY0162165.1 FadR/GntR family transcriptional regulator [Desulfobotulus sp.]
MYKRSNHYSSSVVKEGKRGSGTVYMFEKAKQNRMFQDVVDQIQDAILEGRMGQGDKLPPERELKETFQVSRGTLREALRVLEQKGLIEIRLGVGGGAFVREVATGPVTEGLGLLLRRHRVSASDLAEFRKDLEGGIAALAARKAREEDIALLREFLRDMAQALEDPFDWEAVISADNRVHLALGEMAGNAVYRTIQATIHANIHPYFDRYVPRDKETLEGNYKDLCLVVEAVAAGDASLADQAMQAHLARYDGYIESADAADMQSQGRETSIGFTDIKGEDHAADKPGPGHPPGRSPGRPVAKPRQFTSDPGRTPHPEPDGSPSEPSGR